MMSLRDLARWWRRTWRAVRGVRKPPLTIKATRRKPKPPPAAAAPVPSRAGNEIVRAGLGRYHAAMNDPGDRAVRHDLSAAPLWHSIATAGCSTLEIAVRLNLAGTLNAGVAPALGRIEFRDGAGHSLSADPSIPSGYLGPYVYLHAGDVASADEVTSVTLPLPEGATLARVGLQSWRDADVAMTGPMRLTAFRRGASIVIPAYRAASRIREALDAVARQTAPAACFETIVVLNGPDDGTAHIVADFAAAHPELDIRILSSGVASAGSARNMGIARARFDHVVFLDDDDWLSDNYLAALLARADGKRIVIARVQDVQGEERSESPVTAQLDAALVKPAYTFQDIPSVLAMNACKLTPTVYLRMVRFPIELSSGEDVVFWTELVTRFSPPVEIVPKAEQATYFRVLRPSSVSRQASSYDFAVTQRLAVIDHLDRMHGQKNQKYRAYVADKINAQAQPIEAYLRHDPRAYSGVIAEIVGRPRSHDLAGRLNARLAEHLVISYCFPPAADTSGIVMAKRVAAMGEPTDVICNSMAGHREIDPTLRALIGPRVGRIMELKVPVAFGRWASIEPFAVEAIERIRAIEARKGPYKRMYSRALWPASHFAAALQKIRNPGIYWCAEFSDPLRKGIRGEERGGEISEDWLERHGLRRALADRGIEVPANSSLFAWCELLPIVLAERLVFTNRNQLAYMQSYQDDDTVRQMMAEKATISHHPEPAPHCYGLVDTGYDLDTKRISLGYFGSFYATRGLGSLLDALYALPAAERTRFGLHIFSAQHGGIDIGSVPSGLDIRLNPPLDYLAFLSLSRRFSYLIVNDAETAGLLPLNPYLPSKLSDYRGAGVPVWAICEPGSALSGEALPDGSIRSRIGDRDDMEHALYEMLRMRS